MSLLIAVPGRVNLIGEHLDYHGGTCVPMTLSAGLRIDVGNSSGGLQLACSFGSGRWADLEQAPEWAGYVVAALREVQRFEPSLDLDLALSIEGDLPSGAGLASSAAVTCGVIAAIGAWRGVHLDPTDVVALARRAENDGVGAPTGGLDQWALATGVPGWLTPLQFDVEPPRREASVRWPEHWRILVVDTGVVHRHDQGGYADRRAETAALAAAWGIEQAALARYRPKVEDVVPARLAGRWAHVVSEQSRATAFIEAVRAQDAVRAGGLMNDSHRSLCEDYEVSCVELDQTVKALQDAGAHGARMTGGGFGGCAIALTTQDQARAVLDRALQALDHAGYRAAKAWIDSPAGTWRVLSREGC